MYRQEQSEIATSTMLCNHAPSGILQQGFILEKFNLISLSFPHHQSLQEVSPKSVHSLLSYRASRQTNKKSFKCYLEDNDMKD